ncbi:hypothetical protein ACW2QC_16790 [Virgibacillus sp. FSP13]
MLKIALILAFILPWLTLIWANKYSLKKFMPVTILTGLIMTIIFEIAHAYNWWTIHEYLFPWGYITDTSFAYGLFMMGTFWIFYFTYGKLWVFVLTNIVFDLFMGFAGMNILRVIGVATMHTISEWQYFLVMFFISLVLYVYQRWQETIFAQK